MKIHHIGYLVENIEAAADEMKSLGYRSFSFLHSDQESLIVDDVSRAIRIMFLENSGYLVELVQPVDDSSPAYRLYKKHRNSPYHICYETENIDMTVNEMIESGEYMLVQAVEPAPAIGGRCVAFLVGRDIGLIELLSEE